MKKNSDLEDEIKEFLHQCRFLPLSKHNKAWHHVRIRHHAKKPSKEKVIDDTRFLKKYVPQVPGVYLYLSPKRALIYVGKAKNILHRIRSHYREAFEDVPGDRDGVWHHFFSKHEGSLILLWRSIEHERRRIVIEEMIEEVVGSQFDLEYPRRKRRIYTNKK